MQKLRAMALLVLLLAISGIYIAAHSNSTAEETPVVYFPTIGHQVSFRFFQYWEEHGGLVQQGYPVSDEIQERSPDDGQTYMVQYFERAVFEYHPRNSQPNDVLLSLLGSMMYRQKYSQGAPGQVPNTGSDSRLFSETGKRLGGIFLRYWQEHGGLIQQGYPISDEFTEVSALDGKPYTVQYFERAVRAVFEYHPENRGTQYEVLLTQLGTINLAARSDYLPLPAPPSHLQSNPAGSSRYLLWVDTKRTYPGSYPDLRDIPISIQGIDLTNKRSFTVSQQPGPLYGPNNDGRWAVGRDLRFGPGCQPNCGSSVIAKDLETGETFTVTTRPGRIITAAIMGSKVAWTEDTLDYKSKRVVLADTGTDTITPIAPDFYAPDRPYEIYGMALSDEYLVWLDRDLTPQLRPNPTDTTLRAYNLKSGKLQTVATGNKTTGYGITYFALSGHKVLWTEPALHLTDLSTGKVSTLFSERALNPLISGDVVVWRTYGEQNDLWGLRLPSGEPLLLARGSAGGGTEYRTIAGNWLVGEDSYFGRIVALPLDHLLATPLTPIPTPPPPPPTEPPAISPNTPTLPLPVGTRPEGLVTVGR